MPPVAYDLDEAEVLDVLRDGLRETRPSLFCLDSGLVVTR